MKNKILGQRERATIVKISQGKYEIIGATPEEFVAAKQWASFWGHEIIARAFRPRSDFVARRLYAVNLPC
ncbi:MAG TPA: hypothetical protein VH280_18885 [Verrucomicrobiae bacterium]|nr:hypothetical protein [Verrucomicrobiae bacterium]